MKKVDVIISDASFLLTLKGPQHPRAGEEMSDNGSIPCGAVAIEKGVVVETGPTKHIIKKYKAKRYVDAWDKLVLPGFVDPHTHLVFAGSREIEMEMRSSGASYLDILKLGGGIHSTVKATREISQKELLDISKNRLRQVEKHGTTTVEIKSGYGLEEKAEEKILKVIAQLDRKSPLDVVATFLGAHTVPKDSDRDTYISWLINEAPAKFKKKAEFWDVFCEDGAFTTEESEKILKSAKKAGYKLKIHAGQFNDLRAAGMSALLGAITADHLDKVSDRQLKMMKESGTIAILMPGVPFYLGSDEFPDARRFHKAGVPIALATDFNPGSCPSFSMQMMIGLACLKMKMSAAEAITAATINAAYAIDRAKKIGSIESGKQADIIILDIEHPSQLPYFFGANLVRTVIKNGRVIWDRKD